MAARKKKSLVIIESPGKAKTINKYLGSDYEVVASKGGVRDLIKSRIGIDIEKGWIPNYRVTKEKKDVVAAIKKLLPRMGTIYLATDPDREGEAIAWHLKEILKLDDERVRRVTFNEITPDALKLAFTAPKSINMDLVAAQEARRFLDRVVGYKLSPLLSQRLANTELSAGRVQSVAVRLIVEREREIAAFKPEEYWKIGVVVRPEARPSIPPEIISTAQAIAIAEAKKEAKRRFTKPETEEDEDEAAPEKAAEKPAELPARAFPAELTEWAEAKFEAGNAAVVQPIVDDLAKADYVVANIEKKEGRDRPPPPFITSSLLQEASARLHFSAKKTMQVAQILYMGVELRSEGSVALITYMRTDSTRIAKVAVDACRAHIEREYGKNYLPDKPNVFASAKNAQEAHEAIRPTDLKYTPDKVAKGLAGSSLPKNVTPHDLARLYALIYQRFVACQMKPAVFDVTSVDIKAAQGLLRARGRTMKFDGYRRVLAPGKLEDRILPDLAVGQKLDLLKLEPTQHHTEPPPRYNEKSLMRMLEKEGIGRPSTYVPIMSKIADRQYVNKERGRFFATDLGMKVTDLLVENFPQVMDIKFTRHMEEELDQIETKKFERNQVLNEFYEPFAQALKVAETKMLADAEKCPLCGGALVERFSRFGKFFGCSNHPACKYIKKKGGAEKMEPPKETEIKCPECGAAMLERMGRRGKFLGCSRYPECKTTMSYDPEGKPVLASKVTEHVCEKCGKPMVLRQGKRGPFLACSGYPKCQNAKDVDAQGNPMKPIDSGIPCEKCGSPLHVKKGPRGPFLACSAYPKCRSYKTMPAELKEKYKDVFPAPAPAKELPKLNIDIPCPECGAPMKLRSGRGNYFLGCSKFGRGKNSCKATMELPPELLEKLGLGVGAED